jgi:hypothetical protein
MLLSTLDVALRAGTTALLLLLAALLVRDFRGTASGRLAIALALGSAAHAVSSAAGFDAVTAWRATLIALSTGNVVVLWLFARTLFDDTFELRRWHALPWAAVVGVSLVNCLVLSPAASENFRVLGVGIHAMVMSSIRFGFYCAGGRTNHCVMVDRPGGEPPQLADLHRCRRGGLWRRKRDPAAMDVRG